MEALRTPPTQSASYKWAVIAMLWFVCFFNYADRQAIFSVFPLIKQQLVLSDVQLGILGSSFMWMYALFGPVAGWLCDRLPRKSLVLGGLVFWSVVTGATAVSHSFGQLLICRALGGLGEAFYFPAAMSLISDYHGPATRSRAMSLHQSSVYAGSIAGGAVSGVIGQYYGWRMSFALFGGFGVVLGVLLWRGLREPVRGMSDTEIDAADVDGVAKGQHAEPDPHLGGSILDGFREVFQNPMVLLLVVVFMAANFVAVVFLTWMPTFLYQKFHMSLAMAGLNGTAYLQIASVLGVLSGGLIADSLRRKRPGGRLMTQAIGLLCGVPFLFLTGWTISVRLLVLGMVGFGFFKGLYDANIFAGLYDVVPIERRGAAAGILNSMGWLGGGFAPVLIAVAAAHWGMSACISATAGIYLSIAILLWVGSRRLGKTPAARQGSRPQTTANVASGL
jgi:sugar phosphate permease